MFQLGKTIISEDIIQKDFVCNLSACKGACCIDGDAGAPLEESETKVLEEIYPNKKRDELELMAELTTDKDIKELARKYGMDEAIIAKKLK